MYHWLSTTSPFIRSLWLYWTTAYQFECNDSIRREGYTRSGHISWNFFYRRNMRRNNLTMNKSRNLPDLAFHIISSSSHFVLSRANERSIVSTLNKLNGSSCL